MPKLKHSVVQRSYQCEFCNVKCRRPQDLRRHLFVHTEASFQCDGCGNKFTRYDTLMRHKRDNCRNSHSAWVERQKIEKENQLVQAHNLMPEQEAISQAPIEQLNPTEPQFQYTSPINMGSTGDGTTIRPESPMAFPQYGYSSQASYPPIQPLLKPIQPGPHPPQPSHQASPSYPTSYPSHAWMPPALAVNAPIPPHNVGISPTMPNATVTPSPLPSYGPIPYGYPQLPQSSPSVPNMAYSYSEPSNGGVRTPNSAQATLAVQPQPQPQPAATNVPAPVAYHGWGSPATPPHEVSRELPRILQHNVGEPAQRKANSLQPLEPNPLRFTAEGAVPRFSMEQHDSAA